MVWSVGLAPACSWLDGQDGQLPVDYALFSRPRAQRLDDVGNVVNAGVRLPVSLPVAGDVQLNLEARHVQALRICVACSRRRPVLRRSHAPPGSSGAPQAADVRRTVIEGYSSLNAPDVKDGPPAANSRAVTVNIMAAHHDKKSGSRGPSETILSAPDAACHPIYNIRPSFHTTA